MEYGALDDKFAFEELLKLVNRFGVTKIYETGTYKGWSTLKLIELGLQIETIEVNLNFYNIAKDKLKNFKNVNLHLGDSTIKLSEIIYNGEKNSMFFLDAHWNDLPLLKELEIIAKFTNNPIIIIHDFFVPNGNKIKSDNGYKIVDDGSGSKFGYDVYGDVILNIDYIKDKLDIIYNNEYEYHYTSEIDCVDSGLIYIYPKNKN